MAYKHGVYTSEVETSLTAPIVGTAGLQVIVGTAPVNMLKDPAAAVNVPLLVNNYKEAVEAVGYNDDFEAYTLCECISAAFSVVGVAPMVLINVLDPAKHKADISEKTMQVNDGVAVLDEVGVLLEGLTIKADATPLEAGKDYTTTLRLLSSKPGWNCLPRRWRRNGMDCCRRGNMRRTMIRARSLALDVRYNNAPFAGQVGGEIESLTYIDSAADNSDSIDITLDAQDGKWLRGWLPEKGATLRPRIRGYNWEAQGDRRIIECGLFVLDDVSFSDAPTTLQIGGVSKPSDSDFSELERETIWKNTSIKRIGETIAGRYGLAFTYDADDYDIECDEQDGTDSGYYNQLCKNYGLILKVYARRLWVYDRERYKEKRAVKTFHRTQIRPGSFAYTTTLSGTYTGGYFNYTDADKDIDIVCSVGGGTHTKSVNRRATSVYDASVQLCAELNNANHGTVRLRFGVDGDWLVSAGNCINLAGYGKLDGKYFVDKVTHKVSASGLTTDFECSGIGTAFHYWDVGGKIEYHEPEEDSGVDYDSAYATTSPAANAASSAAGAEAGASVTLTNAPFYVASTSASPACHKSGTYYFYDGILINGRYRMTNTAARCGKLPVGKNVTGWVPASYCIAGKEG